MTTFKYTSPARVMRRVSISDLQVISVDETIGSWFVSELVLSSAPSRRTASPRTQTPYTLRHQLGVLAPVGPELRPGDRIAVIDSTYEVISPARLMNDVRLPRTVEFSVLPVDSLYPLEGDLKSTGGTTVTADVVFSAYNPSESHLDTGSYEDTTGEAPLEYASDLHQNLRLVAGTQEYQIFDSAIDYDGGFVRMQLRRTNAAR